MINPWLIKAASGEAGSDKAKEAITQTYKFIAKHAGTALDIAKEVQKVMPKGKSAGLFGRALGGAIAVKDIAKAASKNSSAGPVIAVGILVAGLCVGAMLSDNDDKQSTDSESGK